MIINKNILNSFLVLFINDRIVCTKESYNRGTIRVIRISRLAEIPTLFHD